MIIIVTATPVCGGAIATTLAGAVPALAGALPSGGGTLALETGSVITAAGSCGAAALGTGAAAVGTAVGAHGASVVAAAMQGEGGEGKVVEGASGNGWASSQESTLTRIVDHSYQKHVVDQNEFGSFFKNPQQWKEYLKSVMQKPSDYFQGGGKTLYWDDMRGVIIIDNPVLPTAFKPLDGKIYFITEVNNLKGIK